MNAHEKWLSFVESRPAASRQYEDELWRKFKDANGFEPSAFERRPPWCVAGARNREWAAAGYLGDPRREAAWALAGYLDRPFDLAYLWLDYAGFNGLLRNARLPYTARKTAGQLKKEANLLATALSAVNDDVARWPFRGILDVEHLLRDSDYQNSIRLPASSTRFTSEQTHIAVQIMLEGARQQIGLPLAGKHSLISRAIDALSQWTPPKSYIDRPNKPGAKPRFAARWLDNTFNQLGGAMPPAARLHLIAELVQVLNELGEWDEEPWTEEQVRSCLGGKSKRKD